VTTLPRAGEEGGSPAPGLPPAIAAHRLVSNGRSAALVRPDAEVDWWCAPDFDAAPLAWSLLDPDGGSARWRCTRTVVSDDGPAGPSTRTTIRTDGGRVECRDGLVDVAGGGVALVRLVRALDGPTEVVHELGLGGLDVPWVRWARGRGVTGDVTVQVVGPPGAPEDGWLVTTVTADASWRGLAVVVGTDAVEVPTLENLTARLDGAEAAARARAGRLVLPRSHPERAADALAVLQACTYLPTGAAVASPTTSLPERVGGDRQFDYRYCWLRDAGLASSVAALLGDHEAAEDYLRFVCRVIDGEDLWAPVVTVRGEPVPTEREVPGATGWAGSLPIRVGNGASGQRQYDAFGMVIEALSLYLETGGRLDRERWALVCRIADAMADAPDDEPSNGIWEMRTPDRLISGDVGRWLALDRAVSIARWHRPWTRRRRWKRERDRARARVLGAMDDDGRLPQAYDRPYRADASALMVPLFGMLDRRDGRAHALVDRVIEDLGAGPFLYRYEPDGRDGFAAGEGAFLPVSFWAVSALAVLGRIDEAEARLEAMCAALPPLLSEEVDPVSGDSMGNAPLVWSHMELARALYIVDGARVRKRYGIIGQAGWRLARLARVRRAR
jgi:hypothetical protein